jgi:hypothetical protein
VRWGNGVVCGEWREIGDDCTCEVLPEEVEYRRPQTGAGAVEQGICVCLREVGHGRAGIHEQDSVDRDALCRVREEHRHCVLIHEVYLAAAGAGGQ